MFLGLDLLSLELHFEMEHKQIEEGKLGKYLFRRLILKLDVIAQLTCYDLSKIHELLFDLRLYDYHDY